MTPNFVFWNVVSAVLNFTWHSVANPCMKFVFDVVEAFSPCSWTGLLGGYYLEFFPKTIGIYHVLAACRGESPPSEEAAAMQDGIVLFALAAMVFLWVATYHGLDDTHTRLKNKVYANALGEVCDPFRPHVLAATLVWVAFKGLMCFGRPLHVFPSNMTSEAQAERRVSGVRQRAVLGVRVRAPPRAVQRALVHVHLVRAAAHLDEQAQLALAARELRVRDRPARVRRVRRVLLTLVAALRALRVRVLCLCLRVRCRLRRVRRRRLRHAALERAALPLRQPRAHVAVAAAPAHRAPHVSVQAVPRQR